MILASPRVGRKRNESERGLPARELKGGANAQRHPQELRKTWRLKPNEKREGREEKQLRMNVNGKSLLQGGVSERGKKKALKLDKEAKKKDYRIIILEKKSLEGNL